MNCEKEIAPMRLTNRALLLAITGASLLVAHRASAQLDVNPPLPNVLLLVDTSGSMEYATDGTSIKCDYADSEATGASQKDRWTQLIEVLTGDVQNYKCYSQDRRTTAFRDEFRVSTVDPYDYNYTVPYHRILSGTSGKDCTIAPGTQDTNSFAWGTTPFKYHQQTGTGAACAATDFAQSSSGVLDTFRDRARFGLMTFDTAPNAGTGITGTTRPNATTGMAGSWSYYLGWQADLDCSKNTCAQGAPQGCATLSNYEVGARNAAAPPWEGRLVPFGPPTAIDRRRAGHQRQDPEGSHGRAPVSGHPHQRHARRCARLPPQRRLVRHGERGHLHRLRPPPAPAASARPRTSSSAGMPQELRHSAHRRRAQPRHADHVRGKAEHLPLQGQVGRHRQRPRQSHVGQERHQNLRHRFRGLHAHAHRLPHPGRLQQISQDATDSALRCSIPAASAQRMTPSCPPAASSPKSPTRVEPPTRTSRATRASCVALSDIFRDRGLLDEPHAAGVRQLHGSASAAGAYAF